MSKKITTKQFTSSVLCFILASTLFTSHFFMYCKNDTWIIVISGFLVSIPIVFMYSAIVKRFPGMSLIEINNAVFGRVLGKIFSALYMLFFSVHLIFYTNDVGTFVKGFLLPKTPMALIIFMFVFICAWAVRNGARSFTRYSAMFCAVTITVILITVILLVKNINVENILPVFSQPVKSYLIGTHIMAIIPYCDIFVFFMMAPELSEPDKFGKSLFKGLIVGAAVMLLIVLRDIFVMGGTVVKYLSPSFEVLRLIDVGDIITRYEILYAVILIALIFFSSSVYYYAITTGISRFFGLSSDKILINIIGVFIFLFGLNAFPTQYAHLEFTITGAEEIFPSIFLILMPVLTLVIAVSRGISSKEPAEKDNS